MSWQWGQAMRGFRPSAASLPRTRSSLVATPATPILHAGLRAKRWKRVTIRLLLKNTLSLTSSLKGINHRATILTILTYPPVGR
jgi:hypothetical protein